jgi:hypothetical protein
MSGAVRAPGGVVNHCLAHHYMRLSHIPGVILLLEVDHEVLKVVQRLILVITSAIVSALLPRLIDHFFVPFLLSGFPC